MIELHDVSKRYGQVHAVRGVSLNVPTGAVVGVLGPNGAGKTTTVRMIAGTVPPTRGMVVVDGLDAVADSRRVRRRLGYLPESNPLYPEMRVTEYLRYRARLHGMTRADARAATDRVVERCWLSDVRRRRVGALSKGFRQRVGLAAALLHDPAVLLLDEPTSGLDPAQVRETRQLIQELAGERTTLIVSHALAEVEQTCDRLVVFASGRVRAHGPADQLLRDHTPTNLWRVSARPRPEDADPTSADAQILRVLRGMSGVRSAVPADPSTPAEHGAPRWIDADVLFDPGITDAGERIGAALAEVGASLRELRRQRVSLEELYISLVSAPDDHPTPTVDAPNADDAETSEVAA